MCKLHKNKRFAYYYLRILLWSLWGLVPSCVGFGSFSPIFGFCFLYHFEPRYSALPWRCTMRTWQDSMGHLGLQPTVSKLKNARENALKSAGRDLNEMGMQQKLVLAKIHI